MKEMETLGAQVEDIICFKVPKRGDAAISGNTINRGNTVHKRLKESPT